MNDSSTRPAAPWPDHSPNTDVVTLVGNPRQGSRTRWVAERVADRLAEVLPGRHEPLTVELADLAARVHQPAEPDVAAARRVVANARVAVVATPVYKASYTGLLKTFLDGYGPEGLADVVAVPVVVTGTPAHALVGEVHLRPLLAELGATVPARALVVTEAEISRLDEVLQVWFGRWDDALRAALPGVRAVEGVLP
ncbi:NAD(P)H-dependent oxidoreductase [Myceligenerans crystallogenes]|uniref:NAD(P)H-dependent oxidoreductase n=1 Tax=Myceligenerans crystallogenes TaxID=316335 RepID=A0ABN2N9A9_9MICO